MVFKKDLGDCTVRITFAVEDERPVSVVGDFNNWDPFAHPLVPRSNGMRSVAIRVGLGSRVYFKYLADGGEFYDDPDADRIEPDGVGGTHCVVDTSLEQASNS